MTLYLRGFFMILSMILDQEENFSYIMESTYTLTHTAVLITQRITGIMFFLELLAQLYRLMISKLSITKELVTTE